MNKEIFGSEKKISSLRMWKQKKTNFIARKELLSVWFMYVKKYEGKHDKIAYNVNSPGVPGGGDAIATGSPISKGGEFSRTQDIRPADICNNSIESWLLLLRWK